MLQIKNISKTYITGDLEQRALDGVSLDLRDNEFVAILGPSGSGKTTLLNIIGGLDRYDSGDLIINGVTTKAYRDRDWDSYRNHTIGFVFQSYNLIPHQTILANVELALTISGISRKERRRRAAEALEKVGLGDQLHKKPNQMSGGQMQRVAIARALVNDPDILLADEPTGALDTETSVQVMDLLKEVASDRLVVMVTHNPDLAEEYATRIVNLKDGKIIADSDPFDAELAGELAPPEHRNLGHASMSFFTALALSLNNLRTKKARTILVAFAGSIGIIGIALILSLSNGVNRYIDNIQEETLSQYPLEIQNTSMDMTALMSYAGMPEDGGGEDDGSSYEISERQIVSDLFSSMNSNDLKSLKAYLDRADSKVFNYARSVEYGYSVTPLIYSLTDDKCRQVCPDTILASYGANNMGYSMMGLSLEVFYKLPEEPSLYEKQYTLKAGRWPQNYDELVLVLSESGQIADYALYAMGIKDASVLDDVAKKFAAGEEVKIDDGPPMHFNYDDFLDVTFRLVDPSEQYSYDAKYDIWTSKTEDQKYMLDVVRGSETLKIVGVIEPAEDSKAAMLQPGIGYVSGLIDHVIDKAGKSEIVSGQLANRRINIFTGNSFDDDSRKAFDMSDLFTIDEDAMANAFSFDSSAMNIEVPDFSLPDFNMDPADLIDTDELIGSLPVLTLDDIINIMKQIDLDEADFDAEAMLVLTDKLWNGFFAYAEEKEFDLTDTEKLEEYLEAYLTDEETKKMLDEELPKVIDMDKLMDQVSDAFSGIMQQYMDAFAAQIASSIEGAINAYVDRLEASLRASMSGMASQMASGMENAFSFDENAFANAIKVNTDEQQLVEILTSLMTTEVATYEGNLRKLGYADKSEPSSIVIYPKDFESKGHIVEILDAYNDSMEDSGQEDKVIKYTDIVGVLMSGVTDIINAISYVLIAFVAISLVVSSIMIGVITYISVLERKKEIGILRAIGASKHNIASVFNAETFITGLLAGIMGVVISRLILIPGNYLIKVLTDNASIRAYLPLGAALILVALSVLLTILGGLIPSSKAAKSDPVTALRTE